MHQLVEARQGVFLEPHVLQIQAHAGAVEHAHDHAFAMHGGHGGHAQIQFTPFDAGLDAAVLRQAALGDVQMS